MTAVAELHNRASEVVLDFMRGGQAVDVDVARMQLGLLAEVLIEMKVQTALLNEIRQTGK